MKPARSRWVRPARDAVGRRVHALIDRRVRELLERELPALEARLRAEAGAAVVGPVERVTVDPTATVAGALLDTRSGHVILGPQATVAHGASILTATFDPDARGAARAASIPPAGCDVVIEAGAWVASAAVVLGPCRIGADAVVAAGAVVTGDVPAGAVVAGVPARELRRLATHRGLPPAVEIETDVGRLYVPAAAPDSGSRGVEAIRALVRSGMTVVDLGAGVGHATLAAAAAVAPDGRVVAVEGRQGRSWLLRANVGRYQRLHGGEIAVETAVDPAIAADVLRIGDVSAAEDAAELIDRARPVIVLGEVEPAVVLERHGGYDADPGGGVLRPAVTPRRAG
jgi:acetyltransferase-like isoleucine patch superfamily enzyme